MLTVRSQTIERNTWKTRGVLGPAVLNWLTFGSDTDPPLEPPPRSLDEVRPIRLLTVLGGTPQRRQWNQYIARYYYPGYKTVVGAQMRYIVHDRPGGLLALLGFSTAARKLAPRDRFIGWIPALREKNLPKVIDNAQFLILPWIEIPNLVEGELDKGGQVTGDPGVHIRPTPVAGAGSQPGGERCADPAAEKLPGVAPGLREGHREGGSEEAAPPAPRVRPGALRGPDGLEVASGGRTAVLVIVGRAAAPGPGGAVRDRPGTRS